VFEHEKLEYENNLHSQDSKYDAVFQPEKLEYERSIQKSEDQISKYDSVFQSEKLEYGNNLHSQESKYDAVFQPAALKYETGIGKYETRIGSQPYKSETEYRTEVHATKYDSVFQPEKLEYESNIYSQESKYDTVFQPEKLSYETSIRKSETEVQDIERHSPMDETVNYWSNGRTSMKKSKKNITDSTDIPPTPSSPPPVPGSIINSGSFEETRTQWRQDLSEEDKTVVTKEKEIKTEVISGIGGFSVDDFITMVNLPMVKKEDELEKAMPISTTSITASRSGYLKRSESEDSEGSRYSKCSKYSRSSESSSCSSKNTIECCSGSIDYEDDHKYKNDSEESYHSDSSEKHEFGKAQFSETTETRTTVLNVNEPVIVKKETHTSPTTSSADYMKKYEYSFATLEELPSAEAPKVPRPISLMTEIPLRPNPQPPSNLTSASSVDSRIAFNPNYQLTPGSSAKGTPTEFTKRFSASSVQTTDSRVIHNPNYQMTPTGTPPPSAPRLNREYQNISNNQYQNINARHDCSSDSECDSSSSCSDCS